MLMMCGVAFEKKIILRLPEGVRIRTTAGSGAHKGREHNLKQKVESHTDLTVGEVTDAARDAVQTRFEEGEYSGGGKEFAGLSKKDGRGKAIDLAVDFTKVDHKEFQKGIQPSVVEVRMAVKYPGLSRAVVATLDTIMADYRVLDLKTGKVSFGQSKADDSMALSTYGMFVLAHYGVLPPDYTIQNVVGLKSGTKTNIYKTTRTKDDLQRQLLRFKRALELIDAGIFLPCDPGHWKCTPEWCGYWNECEYGGGKI